MLLIKTKEHPTQQDLYQLISYLAVYLHSILAVVDEKREAIRADTIKHIAGSIRVL